MTITQIRLFTQNGFHLAYIDIVLDSFEHLKILSEHSVFLTYYCSPNKLTHFRKFTDRNSWISCSRDPYKCINLQVLQQLVQMFYFSYENSLSQEITALVIGLEEARAI